MEIAYKTTSVTEQSLHTTEANRFQIDSDGDIVNNRKTSRAECITQNLCFYCKNPGHRYQDCRKRQTNSTGITK